MSYQFAGFFVKRTVEQPQHLPSGGVWRDIDAPFRGAGVRLPALFGAQPSAAEVLALSEALGFAGADWVYLRYECWAGSIDAVYGLGMRSGHIFGPVENTELAFVKEIYTMLMEEFGVSAQDALDFAPFARGFWGE